MGGLPLPKRKLRAAAVCGAVAAERVDFVLEELRGRAVPVARHRCGVRVLQRLLEHCSGEQTDALVAEVLLDAPRLARHPFGNFCLQHILEHGTAAQRLSVLDVLAADTPSLARHRIASNVVQKALSVGTSAETLRLTCALGQGGVDSLRSLAHSRFGSFVVREVIKQSPATPATGDFTNLSISGGCLMPDVGDIGSLFPV